MQYSASPGIAAGLSPNSIAISLGRWVSGTLFFLSAVTLFVFAIQARPARDHYVASIEMPLVLRPALADADTQPQFHFPDESGLIRQWQPYIAEASARFAVPEAWIAAVMRAESGGRTMLAGQPITSKAGAAGLMQLMKNTYKEMRDRYRLGSDVHNPRDNIMAGAAYLGQLRDRYGYPYLFAAYNAGPTRVDEHLSRGKSLPRETRNYLGLVTQLIGISTAAASPALPRAKPRLVLIAGR